MIYSPKEQWAFCVLISGPLGGADGIWLMRGHDTANINQIKQQNWEQRMSQAQVLLLKEQNPFPSITGRGTITRPSTFFISNNIVIFKKILSFWRLWGPGQCWNAGGEAEVEWGMFYSGYNTTWTSAQGDTEHTAEAGKITASSSNYLEILT